MSLQKFGGQWTTEKLNILTKYLNAYVIALKDKPFEKIYIDAFSGTGSIEISHKKTAPTLFEEYNQANSIDGSAKLALDAANKFDKYKFIELDNSKAIELQQLIQEHYHTIQSNIQVIQEGANIAIQSLCKNINWRKTRGVIFLDPFATQVNWNTLEIIASTKALDLWFLFPFSAVNRMLPKDIKKVDLFSNPLTRIFGDESWRSMYSASSKTIVQGSLLEYCTPQYSKGDLTALENYIIMKLKEIFPYVSPKPRMLYAHNNSPFFLFCFAIANDSLKAIDLAKKIAENILENK